MPRLVGHQVRREQHLGAGHHLHLGGVAVVEQAVGAEIAVDGAEMRAGIGRAAGAADARGGIDDDALASRSRPPRPAAAAPGWRRSGSSPARRPASSAVICVAEEFGQAVGEAAEQVGPRMRLAVPALIFGGAVEAEVGAEVDERHAGGEQIVGQPLASRHGAGRRGSGRSPRAGPGPRRRRLMSG